MRFYLISDNIDTMVGMRLAGIEGIVVHEEEEVQKALYNENGRCCCNPYNRQASKNV